MPISPETSTLCADLLTEISALLERKRSAGEIQGYTADARPYGSGRIFDLTVQTTDSTVVLRVQQIAG